MGGMSPKSSYGSSYSRPSSKPFEYSETTPVTKIVSRNFGNDIPEKNTTSNLKDFKDLLTEYLEVTEKIELTMGSLQQLQQRKTKIEEQIANNQEYEKVANLFNSMKGPKTLK